MEHRALVVTVAVLIAALGFFGYVAMRLHCEDRKCEHGRPVFMNYQCFCVEKPR